MRVQTCLGLLLFVTIFTRLSAWLPKEAAQWAIDDFDTKEKERKAMTWRGPDRRVSFPFLNGDGLRSMCRHVCEDFNRCRMTPEDVKDGECIFVKSDFFEFFAHGVTSRINATYIVISHNGDLSAPDGQNDAPRIGMRHYVTTDVLAKEYASGRMIAMHGQNLWWVNKTLGHPRPDYAHCLPIGIENRLYHIGKQVHIYADALKRFVVDRPVRSQEELDKRPLLLVAFYPKSRVPDRSTVLSVLRVFPPRGVPKDPNPWFNYTDLSHTQWLQAIGDHRFVLAPFGHGLDTHRITEILLMGGIPVMRRSTISSCYDDSDNTYVTTNKETKTRGSLPIVIVDKWEDLSPALLEKEWKRISSYPSDHWDWKRLFAYQWMDRIMMR